MRRPFKAVAVAALASLVSAGAAAAFEGLPPSGAQVNNDPPSIDPTQNAGLVDLTSGSLVAGSPRVPWMAFSQATGASQQIFVRAFKGGAWHTEGFPESLNVDSSQVAQAPSIDFTGAGRTVPWVAWAEPSSKFSGAPSQIFASRFASQPPPAQNGGQWVHEGQQAGLSAPSLNINTNRAATNPSLIGGTTTAGGNPAPWIAWQEFDGQQGACSTTACAPQIFVAHAVPATAGTCPPGTKPNRGSSVGKFCFQQVGIDRVQGPTAAQRDPSLNIDPSRSGIESDIAFTGANDTVPWVVWYENSDSNGGHPSSHGLFNADMVFAARGIPDASGDGGFHWQVVGLGTAGKTATQDVLNTGGTHGIGDCGASTTAEQACSLDAFPAAGLSAGNGGENPTVTAGTMVAGNPTTPWVAWDESSSNGGLHSVFVARLTGGDHFTLLNNGQPISHSAVDATRPDIVFSHNTPYISWHETTGSTTLTFTGHFQGNPANPSFVLDTKTGIPTTTPVASDDDLTDIRSPIASTCPDDPFNLDGASCQGGAVGTPFFAYTNTASGPRKLFAAAYSPNNATTGGASLVSSSSARVFGQINPGGASTVVLFEYGRSTAYGHFTAAQRTGPDEGLDSFSAVLGGLPLNKIIHYRAVAVTDFGVFLGRDRAFIIIPIGRFDRTAKLLSHGRRVHATGPAPFCTAGERIFLTITLTQGTRTAKGAWRNHTCTGRAQRWQAFLTVARGKNMHKGHATGFAVARITRRGRTIAIKRWSAKITLV